ncbi:7TM-DISM domain-containing protein [Rheinheimera sp. UJ63]|uniref:7TM-DISM domain-containing protein n=1 Tax=Rheinheimera sp. UJ63 TaxID=2910157 RepID=UPI001F31EADB|nr:7TM-DISM domain-containing protein [Rheinheimera sp. UJ63]MCF4008592.1 hypothetical protein [Rheinheimera sp. UJ63]
MSRFLTLARIALLCLSLCSSVHAAGTLDIIQQQPHRLTELQYQITDVSLSANELVADPALFHNFSALTPQQNTLRITAQQAVWLLAKIKNPYPEPWDAVLSYHFLAVDKVSFYKVATDIPSVQFLGRSGSAFPFSERPLPLYSFSQPLRFDIAEQVSVLIKLEDAAMIGTELSISSLASLLEASHQQLQYDSMINGALLLLALLALCRGVQQHQPALYALAGFYLAFLLVLSTLNGQAFSRLWPLHPEMNAVFIYISVGASLACLSLFARFSLLRQSSGYGLWLNSGSFLLALLLLFSPLFASGPMKLKLLFICMTLVLSITLLQALFISLTTQIRYTPRFSLLAVAATLQLLLLQLNYMANFVQWLNTSLLFVLAISTFLLLHIPKARLQFARRDL